MEHCQQVICLRWGIHHENLISAFEQQLNADKFTDVTVYVNGGRFRCHRLVLLASSEYFRKIFYHSPFEETIVCLKDVRYEVFGLVLRYLYTGEVCVPLRNVQELWKAVALLKINSLSAGEKCDSKMTQIPLSPPNYQNMTSPDQSSVSSNDMGYDFSSLDLLSTCAVERSMSMNRGGSNACGPSTLKDLKSSNSSGVGGKSKSIGSTTSEHSIPGPSNIHNRIQEKSLKSPRKSKKAKPKKYKQYSETDVTGAIDEVKLTGISALQAAKKFNVPARTLYDKVKKSSSDSGTKKEGTHTFSCEAQFPVGIGANADGSIYANSNRTSETASKNVDAKPQEKCEEYASGSPVDSGISSNGNEDTPMQIDETIGRSTNQSRTESDARSLSEALANSSLEPSSLRVENFLISQRRDNTFGGGIIQQDVKDESSKQVSQDGN